MPKSPYLERPFGSPLFTASAMLFKVVCFAGKKLIDKRFDKWVTIASEVEDSFLSAIEAL